MYHKCVTQGGRAAILLGGAALPCGQFSDAAFPNHHILILGQNISDCWTDRDSNKINKKTEKKVLVGLF